MVWTLPPSPSSFELEKEKAKAAEKEEAKMKEFNEKVRHDMPLTEGQWAAWRRWVRSRPSTALFVVFQEEEEEEEEEAMTRRALLSCS